MQLATLWRSAALTLAVLSLPFTLQAEDLHSGENFHVPLPEGYKQVYGRDSARHSIGHFIPQAQTEDGWTDKIIVQTFRGFQMDAPTYMAQTKNRPADKGCVEFHTQDTVTDTHNGYPSARITMTCTLNNDSGKGSVAMLRVYSTGENFHYVQLVWRGPSFEMPNIPVSAEKFAEWTAFLGAVRLCDTNAAEHPCPQ